MSDYILWRVLMALLPAIYRYEKSLKSESVALLPAIYCYEKSLKSESVSLVAAVQGVDLYIKDSSLNTRTKVTFYVYNGIFQVYHYLHDRARCEKWCNYPDGTWFYICLTPKGFNEVRQKLKEFENNPEIVISVLSDHGITSRIVKKLSQYSKQVEKIKNGAVNISENNYLEVLNG